MKNKREGAKKHYIKLLEKKFYIIENIYCINTVYIKKKILEKIGH